MQAESEHIDKSSPDNGFIEAPGGTVNLEELAKESQDAIGRVRSQAHSLRKYLREGEKGYSEETPPHQTG